MGTFVALVATPTAASDWQIEEIKYNNTNVSMTGATFIALAAGVTTPDTIVGTRHGERLIIDGIVTPTATQAATLYMNMPTGLTINSAKYAASKTSWLGVSQLMQSSGGLSTGSAVGFYDGSDTAKVFIAYNQTGVYAKHNGNSIAINGNPCPFHFEIYITEWALT